MVKIFAFLDHEQISADFGLKRFETGSTYILFSNYLSFHMAMDAPTIISVNNLTKYYGSTLGVRDINFTVNQGEIFGFLGPNGAGKTTTIRLLLDLLRPSSGEIKIFGDGIDSHSFLHTAI
jgi:ABC-type multidrug transport system fused ATPase/permease subunit